MPSHNIIPAKGVLLAGNIVIVVAFSDSFMKQNCFSTLFGCLVLCNIQEYRNGHFEVKVLNDCIFPFQLDVPWSHEMFWQCLLPVAQIIAEEITLGQNDTTHNIWKKKFQFISHHEWFEECLMWLAKYKSSQENKISTALAQAIGKKVIRQYQRRKNLISSDMGEENLSQLNVPVELYEKLPSISMVELQFSASKSEDSFSKLIQENNQDEAKEYSPLDLETTYIELGEIKKSKNDKLYDVNEEDSDISELSDESIALIVHDETIQKNQTISFEEWVDIQLSQNGMRNSSFAESFSEEEELKSESEQSIVQEREDGVLTSVINLLRRITSSRISITNEEINNNEVRPGILLTHRTLKCQEEKAEQIEQTTFPPPHDHLI